MFNIFKTKIINFFTFNKKPQNENCELVLDLLSQEKSEVVILSDTESLVCDLNFLIEAGEYQKVIDLSRKYNFYNAYGLLLIALIENDQYILAQDLIVDLITGTFFHKVILDLESRKLGEVFQTARILYLLKIASLKISTQDREPFVRLYVQIYENIPSFQRFKQKINSLNINSDYLAIHEELVRYSHNFNKKLNHYFDKNPNQFLHCDDFGLQSYLTQREFKEYLILESSSVPKKNAVKHSNHVVALSLNNISDYVYNDSSNKYLKTLAKIDLQTIYGNIDLSEFLDITQKIGIYDLHPKLAIEYYEKGELSLALKILQSLYLDSVTYEESNKFFIERFKEVLDLFIIQILSQLEESQRNNFDVYVNIVTNDKYSYLIDNLFKTKPVLTNEYFNEFVNLSDQIFLTNKILIKQK